MRWVDTKCQEEQVKAPELNKLECGRMYFIHNPNLTEVLIPNFIPTAIDVDMGRVNK